MPNYNTQETHEIYNFSNGLRLVHRQVPHTKIAHCGFILDIGSRDERPHEQGLAHFWEHMAFKGTEKRKTHHILSAIDSLGGELNAYTTKEKICFYASVLDVHFEKAIDVLTDITFQSIFPEKEIEKEKGVILEEMAMYLDDPTDAILDQFDEVIFGNHALGQNILGTTESVKGFTRANFFDFLEENLINQRIIFSSVSALPLKKVVALAEKYFANIKTTTAKPLNRVPFTSSKPNIIQVTKPITQAHCLIGSLAYSLYDRKRMSFFLLNNLLGGIGMNSRLNMTLREKHGLVYSIESSYSAYLDTGLFCIYFGSEKGTMEKSIQLVYKELNKLCKEKLGTLQLHKAKQQSMGQLAIAEESNMNFMLMMGKSILDTETIESLNDIFSQIEQTTVEDLIEVANEVFATDKLSQLVYMPEK
jgi:predicted Zn-dependent peptidase